MSAADETFAILLWKSGRIVLKKDALVKTCPQVKLISSCLLPSPLLLLPVLLLLLLAAVPLLLPLEAVPKPPTPETPKTTVRLNTSIVHVTERAPRIGPSKEDRKAAECLFTSLFRFDRISRHKRGAAARRPTACCWCT